MLLYLSEKALLVPAVRISLQDISGCCTALEIRTHLEKPYYHPSVIKYIVYLAFSRTLVQVWTPATTAFSKHVEIRHR